MNKSTLSHTLCHLAASQMTEGFQLFLRSLLSDQQHMSKQKVYARSKDLEATDL